MTFITSVGVVRHRNGGSAELDWLMCAVPYPFGRQISIGIVHLHAVEHFPCRHPSEDRAILETKAIFLMNYSRADRCRVEFLMFAALPSFCRWWIVINWTLYATNYGSLQGNFAIRRENDINWIALPVWGLWFIIKIDEMLEDGLLRIWISTNLWTAALLRISDENIKLFSSI